MMKHRILRAAVEQEILFPDAQTLDAYIDKMNNNGIQIEIVSEKENEKDGSLIVVLRKRYNPGNEFLPMADVYENLDENAVVKGLRRCIEAEKRATLRYRKKFTEALEKAKIWEENCDELYEQMSERLKAEVRISRETAIKVFKKKAKESASHGWTKSIDEIANEMLNPPSSKKGE